MIAQDSPDAPRDRKNGMGISDWVIGLNTLRCGFYVMWGAIFALAWSVGVGSFSGGGLRHSFSVGCTVLLIGYYIII